MLLGNSCLACRFVHDRRRALSSTRVFSVEDLIHPLQQSELHTSPLIKSFYEKNDSLMQHKKRTIQKGGHIHSKYLNHVDLRLELRKAFSKFVRIWHKEKKEKGFSNSKWTHKSTVYTINDFRKHFLQTASFHLTPEQAYWLHELCNDATQEGDSKTANSALETINRFLVLDFQQKLENLTMEAITSKLESIRLIFDELKNVDRVLSAHQNYEISSSVFIKNMIYTLRRLLDQSRSRDVFSPDLHINLMHQNVSRLLSMLDCKSLSLPPPCEKLLVTLVRDAARPGKISGANNAIEFCEFLMQAMSLHQKTKNQQNSALLTKPVLDAISSQGFLSPLSTDQFIKLCQILPQPSLRTPSIKNKLYQIIDSSLVFLSRSNVVATAPSSMGESSHLTRALGIAVKHRLDLPPQLKGRLEVSFTNFIRNWENASDVFFLMFTCKGLNIRTAESGREICERILEKFDEFNDKQKSKLLWILHNLYCEQSHEGRRLTLETMRTIAARLASDASNKCYLETALSILRPFCSLRKNYSFSKIDETSVSLLAKQIWETLLPLIRKADKDFNQRHQILMCERDDEILLSRLSRLLVALSNFPSGERSQSLVIKSFLSQFQGNHQKFSLSLLAQVLPALGNTLNNGFSESRMNVWWVAQFFDALQKEKKNLMTPCEPEASLFSLSPNLFSLTSHAVSSSSGLFSIVDERALRELWNTFLSATPSQANETASNNFSLLLHVSSLLGPDFFCVDIIKREKFDEIVNSQVKNFSSNIPLHRNAIIHCLYSLFLLDNEKLASSVLLSLPTSLFHNLTTSQKEKVYAILLMKTITNLDSSDFNLTTLDAIVRAQIRQQLIHFTEKNQILSFEQSFAARRLHVKTSDHHTSSFQKDVECVLKELVPQVEREVTIAFLGVNVDLCFRDDKGGLIVVECHGPSHVMFPLSSVLAEWGGETKAEIGDLLTKSYSKSTDVIRYNGSTRMREWMLEKVGVKCIKVLCYDWNLVENKREYLAKLIAAKIGDEQLICNRAKVGP